jgi:recombination protein RecA
MFNCRGLFHREYNADSFACIPKALSDSRTPGTARCRRHRLAQQMFRTRQLEPRCAEPRPRRQPDRRSFEPNLPTHIRKAKTSNRFSKPWSRIEQALSAADLLLQGGGFSAIVLDMAGVAPEYVSRVQLSIWFRYRAAAERTQASILLLTQRPCAKSAGELLLRFRPGNARNDEATVFTGIEHCLEVERRRFAPAPTNVIPMRESPQRESFAQWRNQSTWAGVR